MDVSADPRNCGGCGLTCLFPHATEPSCQTGQCLLGICETGFGNCNGDPLDGCETLLGSAEHCRSCADVCRYPHQSGSCVQGACQTATCDAGYRDCNADALDGCETHTAEDSANCGGCDTPCARLEVCSAGICVLGCPDGDDDGHSKEECGGDDCDDSDRTIYPDAAELCDGQDNDCDDAIDEGFDQDGDQMTSCGTGTNPDCCDTGTENSLGCTPQSAVGIHPDAAEICGDGIDQDCDGSDLPCTCLDSDGDGYKEKDCGGKDCDDTDPDIRPGAEEICDEIDNDCDGLTDEDDVCATGSGCSCAHGPAPALGLAFSLLALLALRRRVP
jgi:MYXO-CTERM domain-containing protein